MSDAARLDLQRRDRIGMVEAIWGEHKTAEQIAGILLQLRKAGEPALATRVDPGKAEAVRQALQAEPAAAALVEQLQFHAEARCLSLGSPAVAQPQLGEVLIACAGMEGALPTVLAGLVSQPVIGVPVSVGYGVSAGGMAALQGMLASCAPGLSVMNIDNGYGAAMAALRILRLANGRQA
jgi:NCAIR mutase (PurE)-related protein